MSSDQLAFISSWASIASLVISIVSLLLLRSIKANVIRFHRKQRLNELKAEVIKALAGSFSAAEIGTLLCALRRNYPTSMWSKPTVRGRLLIELHRRIDDNDLPGIKDVFKDLNPFSEDV